MRKIGSSIGVALIAMVVLSASINFQEAGAFPTRTYGPSTASNNTWTGTQTFSAAIRAANGSSSATAYGFTNAVAGGLFLNAVGDVRMQSGTGSSDFVSLGVDAYVRSGSATSSIAVGTSDMSFTANNISALRIESDAVVRVVDSAAKGTCDSTKAGGLKYEVVANVGTLYVCRQTGAGTYAWAALH